MSALHLEAPLVALQLVLEWPGCAISLVDGSSMDIKRIIGG
jgi:hypothetical protein